MRNNAILFGAVLLLAACSSPKYAYHFDHYDYNSGRKQTVVAQTPAETIPQPATTNTTAVNPGSPLAVGAESLVASAGQPVAIASPSEPSINETPARAEDPRTVLAKKYSSLSKTEKKEFRQAAKKQLKAYMKAKKAGDTVAAGEAINALDYDLKMAIIFGAVGLTLTLFGGVSEAFWILGVIAIVVGVVFLVKWLVRQ